MLGADHRTPFHHHREGQPPLREGCDGGQARLPHLTQRFIDGIVAIVTAIGRAMVVRVEP
jgi:hypothetical protein